MRPNTPDSCSTVDYIRRTKLKPHSYEEGWNSGAIPPTHTRTEAHHGAKVMVGFQLIETRSSLRLSPCWGFLISSHSQNFQQISIFSGCAPELLQLSVWLWFTVFTKRLSPQSGFGHPATAIHENAGSRHQRLLRDYSSQEHEITLWQIQLAWQGTTSLIRSHSGLNQIAYKCPKLNQAAPWNVPELNTNRSTLCTRTRLSSARQVLLSHSLNS